LKSKGANITTREAALRKELDEKITSLQGEKDALKQRMVIPQESLIPQSSAEEDPLPWIPSAGSELAHTGEDALELSLALAAQRSMDVPRIPVTFVPSGQTPADAPSARRARGAPRTPPRDLSDPSDPRNAPQVDMGNIEMYEPPVQRPEGDPRDEPQRKRPRK
jgi:hypothetical protein